MNNKRKASAMSCGKEELSENKLRKTSESSTSIASSPAKRSLASPESSVQRRLSVPITTPSLAVLRTEQPKTASKVAKHHRYSAPVKMPDSSVSKAEKSLSSIVKPKHKNKGGAVAWRKELYGTRPGSAQARLENLRAKLQQEIEDSKAEAKKEAPRLIPAPKPFNIVGPGTQNANEITNHKCTQSNDAVLNKSNVSVNNLTVTSQHSNTPAVNTSVNTIDQPEDGLQMDVDDVEMVSTSEQSSAISTPPNPGTFGGMECDLVSESNISEAASIETNGVPIKREKEKAEVTSELKSKYSEGLSAFSSYFYCIIDTCVFIEHYTEFERFLTKKYAGRQPIVVVPYKVLHELDIVKHKKPNLVSNITPVIRFLHRFLRAKDPRVKGQHPWDDTVELMPINSPDDSIVNCALQVQSVAASAAKVLLVSNDCNMLTKALVANLDSCTMEELQKDYEF